MKADKDTFIYFENEFRKFIESEILLDRNDDFETRVTYHSKNVWMWLKTSKCTKKFYNGITLEIRLRKQDSDIEIAFLQTPSDEFLPAKIEDVLPELAPELQKFVSFNINYFIEKHDWNKL